MSKHYLVQLDGLRLMAVASVLFCHWIVYPQLKIFNDILAATCLHLFFVLSAFLITTILINAKNSNQNTSSNFFTLRQFYIRRFLRIFPLYYLVIGLGYIINIPTAHENIVWYLTYSTNIAWFYYGVDCGYFSHLWSLAVEEQFYLLFPFLILFIPTKYLFKALLLITAFAIVSKLAPYLFTDSSYKIDKIANGTLPCCLDCFGIGALLAYYTIFEKNKLEIILKKRFFFFISLILFIALTLMRYYNKSSLPVVLFWQLSSSVFCFWVIGMASLQKFKSGFKLFLENGVVRYLGKISYGIYVYHYFIPMLLVTMGLKYYSFMGAPFVYAILYSLITVGLSMVSWHIYENPLNKLKRYIEYTKN